jgi:polyisoprenoid-binding protein YceI
MRQHWKKIVIGVVVATIVGVTAGPWVYIHWIKDPPKSRLTINDAPPITGATNGAGSTDPTSPAGTGPASAAPNTWNIASGSQVGYRVVEVLFGQHTEGVGRTSKVTGSITLDGAKVSAATFTVDMTSLKSDDGRRDHRFTGEIMNTATIPTATFTLTKPIDLGTVPADGKQITASATGDMLLHGVTKSVTFDVTAKKTGNSIAVSGSFDVKFADYNINNPSANFVTTQDHGLIEFALAFAKG